MLKEKEENRIGCEEEGEGEGRGKEGKSPKRNKKKMR